MPVMPTKAYIGPIGCSPPKISADDLAADRNDEPGDEWSTPDGSKITPS